MNEVHLGGRLVDTSSMDTITCPLGCSDRRTFRSEEVLQTHVETAHADQAREFNAKQRKVAAQKKQAQPDGSYPIKNAGDLRNAIQAYGRSKNKAATKAHIIRRARALGLTKLLPAGWGSDTSAKKVGVPYKIRTNQGGKFCVVNAQTGKEVHCHVDKNKALRQLRAISANEKASLDVAAEYRFPCYEQGCERAFLEFDVMLEHAEAVHTFNDIERLVSEAVREKYHKRGDYKASPPTPAVWAWTQDLSEDWVVFTVETDGDTELYKASYVLTDGAVTLGDPKKVKRRTVYEEIKDHG